MSATADIISLRPYLFRIAYSMTGVVEEAEDLVQDAFEKWLKREGEEVKNPKAYLARIVVNSSIDRVEELKREREMYTGPWLPEPYIAEEQEPSLPALDFGLMFLLERLNPAERAVFILRESFDEAYESIAELTGFTPENCRQLLHRAHEKTQRRSTRPVDPEAQKKLVEAFLLAMQQQDRSLLENLLRQDIALYADGGGKRAASIRPLEGFEMVFKFLYGVVELNKGIPFSYRFAWVNGRPAALLMNESNGELDSALTIDFDESGISSLYFIRNPDKLVIRK